MWNPLSAWSTVLDVVLYPSTWLHEQTHYLVFRPYATTSTHDYAATQEAASVFVEVEGMPAWRYVLGALAPTLAGLIFAMLAVVASFTMPLGPARADAVQWLVIGAYWFTYTIPSMADIQTAAEGIVEGSR